MRTVKMIMMSLTAAGLLVAPTMAKKATAQIRVDATVVTPNVRVRVANTSPAQRVYRKNPNDVRRVPVITITRRDRRIARHLSRYTGVPVRRLIQLRRQGHRWIEIGHWFHVPRPVLQAAMDSHGRKRARNGKRWVARCSQDGHALGRVSYFKAE